MTFRLSIRPNDKTLSQLIDLVGENKISYVENHGGQMFNLHREYQVLLRIKEVNESIEMLNKIKNGGFSVLKYNLDDRD